MYYFFRRQSKSFKIVKLISTSDQQTDFSNFWDDRSRVTNKHNIIILK